MPAPLAMKFWLSRRGGQDNGSAGGGRALGKVMSIESLEHMVRSRVRMFLRHTWLVAILGTVVLAGTIASGIYFWREMDQMRIAAGPLDVQFVRTLSAQITKQHPTLHLQLIPTSAPKDAAEAMSKGQADFAILPSNLVDRLNWPVVGILRQNVMAFIVPATVAANKPKPGEKTGEKTAEKAAEAPASTKSAKGAKGSKKTKAAKTAKADKSDDSDDSDDSGDGTKFGKVTDLAGKRIGIVTGSEATAGLLELVLGHYGVPLNKVTVTEIAPENIGAAVKDNQIDALFVAGPAIGKAVSNAVAAAGRNGLPPSFIAIDQADGIANRNPAFASTEIDAGTFGGSPPAPDDKLTSLSFAEYLVARRSVHETLVATLAKVLYSSRQTFAVVEPGQIKIEAPSTDKDADIVLHPGALAYLSDSQQSFFDKYGDDIFYGLLIFPVFGSGIAAVASFLLRDTRTKRLRLLQRVLDLVRKAHAAQTVQTLDQLQIEADNLVIAIIHLSEHEEFDETARMSFSFALDQLRFAIAGRRAAILDPSASSTDAAASAKAAAA
jgi:TRAP-type uncharacterized transport system substrate-binding protein